MQHLNTNQRHLQVIRLLELITDVNESIAINKRMNDSLGKKQDIHIKSKYVKELAELLKVYDLPFKLEQSV